MKRTQIYRIYDLQNERVCETSCKKEIAYYKSLGYSIVATGSYVKHYVGLR